MKANPSSLSTLILLLLSAIWGLSFTLIKIAAAEIPPFTLVAIRTVLATLILFAILVFRKASFPRAPREWCVLLTLGLFNGVIPYTAITWGETRISSGLASILTASMPLFTILFSNLGSQKERLSFGKLTGIFLGFFGVVVLCLPPWHKGVGSFSWGALHGQLAILVAAACYSLSAIIAYRYLKGVSHVMAATGQFATTALLMLPLSLAFDQPLQLRPSIPAIASLLVLSVVCTAFAYILYFWLIAHIGATRTSLVTYLIPFAGVSWGALILHERIGAKGLAGLLLIVLGVGLVNRRHVQPPSKHPTPGASHTPPTPPTPSPDSALLSES